MYINHYVQCNGSSFHCVEHLLEGHIDMLTVSGQSAKSTMMLLILQGCCKPVAM
jgi:hypothetical protein